MLIVRFSVLARPRVCCFCEEQTLLLTPATDRIPR